MLRISSKGAQLRHATTGKVIKSSLGHLRRCLVRQDDEEFQKDGGLKFSSNDHAIVRMFPRKSSSDPKWQVAKLLHPTPDEDAWAVQWCNASGEGPTRRCERSYRLAWQRENEDSSAEIYASNAPAGCIPIMWVATLSRFITAGFKLSKNGRLPPEIKAIIKSKFAQEHW